MRFSGIILIFAVLSIFLGTPYATTNDCSDGTKYFACSKSPGNVGFRCAPGGLARDLTCKCEDMPGYVMQGSGESSTCVQAKCDDGTNSGNCANAKPKVCLGGASYSDNATKCGCPAGKKISANGINCEFIPCSDGTVSVPEGLCSPKKAKKCVGGQLVDKATECGCPVGQTRNGETCSLLCSDGTPDGQCSAAKPKKCVNGYLLDSADACGCPEGQTKVGKQCSASSFGDLGSPDLLGGAGEGGNSSSSSGTGSNPLSCCCLPAALILLAGGFAFAGKK
jgi:hypothetical protein